MLVALVQLAVTLAILGVILYACSREGSEAYKRWEQWLGWLGIAGLIVTIVVIL